VNIHKHSKQVRVQRVVCVNSTLDLCSLQLAEVQAPRYVIQTTESTSQQWRNKTKRTSPTKLVDKSGHCASL